MKQILPSLFFLMTTSAAMSQSWNIAGNSGTTTSNFVGNTDSVALIFRTNNLERARITANEGNLLLGTTTNAGYKLDIIGSLRTSLDARINNISIGKGPGTGINNIIVGNNAFVNNITGYRNVAVGTNTLAYNKSGHSNTAIGTEAMGNVADSNVSGIVSIGNLSRVSGDQGISIGTSSFASVYSVSIGSLAAANSQATIVIGRTSEANSLGNISIGYDAKANNTGGIALGYGLQTTGSYQLLIGNRNAGYGTRDVYIGGGVVQTNASSYGPLTIQPTGQSGTNQTGQTIRIATGKGTGTGTSGDIHLMTSVPRSSGDTLQNLKTAMIIKGATGSVGIGTTNVTDADYKLFVETGIRTRKVKVDITSWPDYVFDKKYKLQNLAEVENYIRKNKHLPEVPSAQEVEKEGINLGENQAILLKKIEELTLHLIEMDKRVQQLEAENKMLMKKTKK